MLAGTAGRTVSGPDSPHRTSYPQGGWSALRHVESYMDRAQKKEAVAELKQTFNETSVVVVTRNLGLTVAQSTGLRNRMRDAGARYKVAKNTLALIALEGTTYAPISDMLNGPTRWPPRPIRSPPPRPRSISPRPTIVSRSSAGRWARRSSTRTE